MKTEEDEAFDELAKRQGSWGGGFKAKQDMAMHKTQDQHICRHYKQWQHCHICDLEAQVEALAQPAQEPDALTIAYQSGFYDGKKAARAKCIELVLAGSSMPVQTRTLEALQSDRKRIAKLIEEDGK